MFVPEVFRFLSSEGECVALLRRVRWPDGVTCPICGSRGVIRWCRYRDYQRYMCKVCFRTFNDKTGTIFHYSRMSLRCWFLLIILFTLIHTSIRSIGWLLGVSYMSVFRACKRILISLNQPTVKLGGVVEVDESYQTAGLKGRNNSSLIKMLGRVPRSRGLKRRGRGRYEVDKVPVFAFVERGGARLFTAAKDVTESTILALVEQRIEPGSKAYTDEYPPYKTLNTIYNHESVNHSIGEYVRGDVHINTCEAEFSILRPFIALHRGIAKYNIQLYTKLYQLHRHLRHTKSIQALQQAIKATILITLLNTLAKTLTNNIPN